MTLAAPQPPAAPADEGSDKETMRKQLLKMGVPQAQIDQILQQLDEKLKEGGLNQETRDSLMLKRRRDVTIDVDWKGESHRPQTISGAATTPRCTGILLPSLSPSRSPTPRGSSAAPIW